MWCFCKGMNYFKNIWRAILGMPYEVVREKEVIKEVVAKRNFLGSIDKDQVQYLKNMTKTERDEHNGNISTILNNPAFKLELNSMMDTQVYWYAEKADGDRQHVFGSGTLNGIALVLERFELINSEVLDRNDPSGQEDPLQKYGILGEFSFDRLLSGYRTFKTSPPTTQSNLAM